MVVCNSKAGSSTHLANAPLVAQVAQARQMIDTALAAGSGGEMNTEVLFEHLNSFTNAGKKQVKATNGAGAHVDDLRHEIDELKKENSRLTDLMNQVLSKMAALETRLTNNNNNKVIRCNSTVADFESSVLQEAPAAKKPPAPPPADDDDDEDIDLFGSSDDEVDEAKEKLKEQRLAAYAAKKSKSALELVYDFA